MKLHWTDTAFTPLPSLQYRCGTASLKDTAPPQPATTPTLPVTPPSSHATFAPVQAPPPPPPTHCFSGSWLSLPRTRASATLSPAGRDWRELRDNVLVAHCKGGGRGRGVWKCRVVPLPPPAVSTTRRRHPRRWLHQCATAGAPPPRPSPPLHRRYWQRRSLYRRRRRAPPPPSSRCVGLSRPPK